MMLTKKLIAKIAVGIAVLIVIGFIIWKIRGKSAYSVESIKNSTDITSYEYKLYSNLALCQNTFTDSTLGSVVAHDTISCDGTIVTIGSLLPHQYVVGDTIYVQGVSSDGTTIKTTKGYNTKENVSVSVTAVDDVYTFKYRAVDGTCSGNDPAIAQKGYSWKSGVGNVNDKNTTRVQCITSNVSIYMDNKCKWASNVKPTDDNSRATEAEITAYNNYAVGHTSDLDKIKAAYANLILIAPTAATDTRASAEQIKAAREADFTAATRKYLNTVCDKFYAQTSTVDPATGEVAGLPNTPYNAYVNTISETTGRIGFNPTLVTDANILNWARYASARDTNGNFTGLAPLVAGSTLYTLTKPNTDGTLFPGMMNWQIAQDVGPGTVTRSGTITALVRTS